MTDNRNTILAVILSGLVLIGWQYFFNLPQMEKQRAAQQAQSEMVKPAPQAGTTTTPQTGAAPVCGVVVVPACGAGFTISLWACCAARCFSICGRLKKYCQPISTRPDRMTARMVLRLSVIVQISSFNSVCGLR